MRLNKIVFISLACAIGAAAQDKITVPLTNPAQPATVKAHLISGSINVTVGAGGHIVVTSTEGARASRWDGRGSPPGMTRIGGRPGLDIEEDHNVVNISAGSLTSAVGVDLSIEVPVNTNLQLSTINGSSVEVTGVDGDLEIENSNGGIKLTGVSGSVVAHTLNGEVVVSLDRVTGNKPMSFTSLNGKVDVTLPADTRARLHMKSDNGSIFSDFDVKLDADSNKPVVNDTRGQNGTYKITVDKTINGTINGGGPEYTFQTMNGEILIHKR